MIGVSFDPGQDQYQNRPSGPNASTAPSGVQEAIRILSLRLPKVVGANAISPRALLTSPGSAGTPVDGVVQRIIQKYFPQASPETLNPMFAPIVGQPSPDKSNTMPVGDRARYVPPRAEDPGQTVQPPRGPSIKVEKPAGPITTPQLPGGRGDNPYQDMTFAPPPPPPNPFVFPTEPENPYYPI